MKIMTFLFFISLMHASASVFSQKITYQGQNIPLTQFFTEVYKQTGYSVVWSTGEIKSSTKINANFKNVSLEDALKESLKGLPVDFSVNDKLIVIRKQKDRENKRKEQTQVFAEDITVTGSVKDAKGNVVPGVNISVVGNTKLGTVTDNNGNFVLTVKDGSVLRISSIGFVPQSFKISTENKTLKIVLQEDVKQAEEIVITAYGKKERKEAVVGSVTSIKPADMKIPASNLTTALAGQAAGIIAYQPTGQPGQDNAQFLSGVLPLLVIK